METMKDVLEAAQGSFLFNVNLIHTQDGDILYEGDAGEELRLVRKIVSDHNKLYLEDKEIIQYRIGLQGRLGPDSPHAHKYKGCMNKRVVLEDAAYVGVYLWWK